MLHNYIVAESDFEFYGMCGSINDMYNTQIDKQEYYLLKDYLQKHKPLKAKLRSFFWSDSTYQYWWTMRVKKPRLRWIDHRLRIEIRKQKLKKLFR